MTALSAFIDRTLRDPMAPSAGIDCESSFENHRKIIESKPFLNHLYRKWYAECERAFFETGHLKGPVVEIGSGAGFLERSIPGLIKTDCVPNPYAQRVMNAERLEFADGELRALFVVCALHHMADPGQFLAEAERCLKPGGRLVLIEPTGSPLLKILTKFVNHYEHWDGSSPDWKGRSGLRMSGANLAIPWIIFFRDRQRFAREYPKLKVRGISYNNFLLYILSGGVSYRSLAPAFLLPVVEALDSFAGKFLKGLCCDMVITIEKV